jgi:uncharacterized membrane protein
MKDLIASKKFTAALIGILVVIAQAVLAKLHVNVSDTQVTSMLAMLGTYILGQGIADHGKEAALINADAASAPAPQKSP